MPTLFILLADDDNDDRMLFQMALEELNLPVQLKTVPNGEQLMELINREDTKLPDLLFMDINMPLKSGFNCLLEIKGTEKLKQIRVIIFTTTYEEEIINQLYKNGAQYFMRKPNNFSQLKNLIHRAYIVSREPVFAQPSRENFVLSQQSIANEEKYR